VLQTITYRTHEMFSTYAIHAFALVLVSHFLVRHFQVRHFPVRHFPVRHFPVLQIPPLRLRPSFSSPAISTPATSSVIFQSCKFHPCDFVCHFPVLQIPPPVFRWSVIFHSCKFQSPHQFSVLHFQRRLAQRVSMNRKWIMGRTCWRCQAVVKRLCPPTATVKVQAVQAVYARLGCKRKQIREYNDVNVFTRRS